MDPFLSDSLEFPCTRCDEHHPHGEPGFRWPDIVFALDVTQEEQAPLADLDNEDTLEFRGRTFIRGWARAPIRNRALEFGIGFWIEVPRFDFLGFASAGPGWRSRGRIANQALFLAPTLGAAAEVAFREDGLRPTITLTDTSHPFARAQRDGITVETLHGWQSDDVHHGEAAPAGKPFSPNLATHGWDLVEAADADKKPIRKLAVGDTVKLLVRFIGTDGDGDPTELRAGWWVRVDTKSRDRFGATLANKPRVPSTLSLGSRMWITREHPYERE